MNKKKIGRAICILSAFFILEHCFGVKDFQALEGERNMILDKIKAGTVSFASRSVTEFFPFTSFGEEESYLFSLLKNTGKRLTADLIPAVDFCEDYWEDKTGLATLSDQIPSYFLEADVEKEEKVRDVSMETKEVPNGSKTYTKKQLSNYQFLMKNFYIVDSTTSVAAGELKGDKLASKDLSLDLEGNEPKILIYHTHGSEDFRDSKKGKKEDTIIGVGDKLASVLEETYHIKVYHDRSVYDTINGVLDRSKAYTYAGNGVVKLLKKYPSIEVVIDLHRDAVGGGKRLVTEVNGKKTAQIMFFNGMSRTAKNGDIGYLQNPNKETNLAFSLQMQLAAAEQFPGFTRKIYLKGYRYNLHLKPRSLLIEAGAQTNTVEEVKNAMEPLAKLLNTVLKK